MGGAPVASPPLEDSSTAGSDMLSEPVTVSCGLLLTPLGQRFLQQCGQDCGAEMQIY